uniref:Uncharacterized protein n=1 Tax=Rhizophora mucronata TaxID=61149 RepID=A0A2P2Q0L4_RHIMU
MDFVMVGRSMNLKVSLYFSIWSYDLLMGSKISEATFFLLRERRNTALDLPFSLLLCPEKILILH